MYWFLYDNGLRHAGVKENKMYLPMYSFIYSFTLLNHGYIYINLSILVPKKNPVTSALKISSIRTFYIDVSVLFLVNSTL